MGRPRPEKVIRNVLEACADCDTCRFLMDESCLLFPELYRLYDKEKEQGCAAGDDELRRLSERCTLCGLCPCPNIRADVIRCKTERVRKEGMPLHIRLLADVQRVARWGGMVPGIVNRALSVGPISRLSKKIAGVHPQRSLPRLAEESFFSWARRQGLDRFPDRRPAAAYFAGCTAGYFFPEVARAAVGVLQRTGISVYVPPQQCCGMPTLLEGDERTSLERARFNLEKLLAAKRHSLDVVCSCPTCGYLLKVLLKEGAVYSPAYQRSVGAASQEILVPDAGARGNGFVRLKKSIYAGILTDDGYFSAIDPLKRISLAERVMDLGEYLARCYRDRLLKIDFAKQNVRMAYYAPCHQREQGIGSPYLELMSLIPGLKIIPVGGALDCCGMGGSLGFKKSFHSASVTLGTSLAGKIRAAMPGAIVTDCLSCRLQFQHLLPYPVHHPIEVLSHALKANEEKQGDV